MQKSEICIFLIIYQKDFKIMLRFTTLRFGFSNIVQSAKLKIQTPQFYLLDDLKSTYPSEITVNRDQILQHYRNLSTMRELELMCDKQYKAKKIRGFCHLYTGQESVAQGLDSVLTYDDPLITAYRVHCNSYKRGISIRQIMAQMFGKQTGSTKGKGGSMHYYKKSSNFYGGNGIVGAQIPVGTGLAFALKYQDKKNVAAVMFGDGASNQGQLYEAMNMAKLWKLPVLYICQNNIYGMGTSIQKSSMNPLIYTRGDKISGIRIRGNHTYEVKEATRWAKKYAIQNGPIFVQFMTYRYSGHSMSDPGTTYRTRQQVKAYRSNNDPLLILHNFITEQNLGTKEQLDKIQEQEYERVAQQTELALKDPDVNLNTLTDDVYEDNEKHYIRGKLYEQSVIPKGQRY